MATAGGPQDLRNETAINVSGLLKGQVGATREFALHLDRLVADGETVARDVNGPVLLTRLRDGVMVTVEAKGLAPLICVGCLREYDQPFDVSFDEEFRQTVDVRTGLGLGVEIDDEGDQFFIDENHELDLAEPLRQEILVSLPMRPTCGPDCPGPDVLEVGGSAETGDDAVDDRFAALANLLEDDTK
ncbi:MAG: DUF177 domain-containing protein [Thermomicrobiales bacterium]